MDLRPQFIGLEHQVTIDKDFVALMRPHQQSIIYACREKFRLDNQTWLFCPDQVYVVMMELSPLWVHGRELGRRLYGALWSRMSDPEFLKTEQGIFTWLAIALKQEVYVSYYKGHLFPIQENGLSRSAVLDRLDLLFDEATGLNYWKAEFCIDNYEMIPVTGSTSHIIQFFVNPRPIPVDYLRPRIRADLPSCSYQG
ncbi:uncharacterized protein N7469_004577 [Penicillium citrinum]|uniref:Uncharacterized protein n=1 Tax=Penicillium citrinum TaxID=5077 RepID=A0A9W9P4T7_PENCI|nr:uncharacterized protein N7469_004577 [Penicillium citrinum]KAJ5235409.1 hypothetical protein N7469_004577 [Penicillium citrinum]